MGDELIGFVGLHNERFMDMLEAFLPYRHRGFACYLKVAETASELVHSHTPWGQFFPENNTSIQLQFSLGLRFGYKFQSFMDCQIIE